MNVHARRPRLVGHRLKLSVEPLLAAVGLEGMQAHEAVAEHAQPLNLPLKVLVATRERRGDRPVEALVYEL
ncbi:MAG: hypothetical protein DRJ69_06310 [Thermoprotei archaeon]|nr:MAG: hypothetical protein DRJ69_06310 [Thermoprotei archaeon]